MIPPHADQVIGMKWQRVTRLYGRKQVPNRSKSWHMSPWFDDSAQCCGSLMAVMIQV